MIECFYFPKDIRHLKIIFISITTWSLVLSRRFLDSPFQEEVLTSGWPFIYWVLRKSLPRIVLSIKVNNCPLHSYPHVWFPLTNPLSYLGELLNSLLLLRFLFQRTPEVVRLRPLYIGRGWKTSSSLHFVCREVTPWKRFKFLRRTQESRSL